MQSLFSNFEGSTRSWFRKLSLRTFDSFGNLSRIFIANFMSCRVRKKNASHLFIVYQKDGESLKDYVKHFNQDVLKVEDPSDKVVVMAMMKGLRPSQLFDSLSKNSLKPYRHSRVRPTNTLQQRSWLRPSIGEEEGMTTKEGA